MRKTSTESAVSTLQNKFRKGREGTEGGTRAKRTFVSSDLRTLMSMGFEREPASDALVKGKWNLEAALMILSGEQQEKRQDEDRQREERERSVRAASQSKEEQCPEPFARPPTSAQVRRDNNPNTQDLVNQFAGAAKDQSWGDDKKQVSDSSKSFQERYRSYRKQGMSTKEAMAQAKEDEA
eukprot:CAMPEP_0185780598 /NCGR_PEP_ID=MMETSP1174-20130828/99626_1 /TAXON_ID=35687 /ORGANISM="Dictyocha speculum, Strain CCMP1381" /LENGTH=180 /DNA_ID=CAMNT_0028470225 /DNA_START=45 /DNA_END=587 /DNA_ORIENTATION=-